MTFDIKQAADGLIEQHRPTHRLGLRVGAHAIELRTNSEALLGHMRGYFGHMVTEAPAAQFSIVALEAPEPDFDITYKDWPRDEGKAGRKDTYADVRGGRAVRKVRTGMQFLLEPSRAVAVGPCLQNKNQVINLVNSQYLSHLVRRGYIICHSAAVMKRGVGLGLSGVSGAGKSTLALQLVSRGLDYVSNDRLLVRKDAGQVHMAGVPKMPRINPGTILGNKDLWPILSEERLEQAKAMPRQELWQLEEKYDADVEQLFGAGRTILDGNLSAFVVLTWSPRATEPMQVFRGRLKDRPDLLPAVTKHAGVFHSDPERGILEAPKGPPDPAPYLEHMGELPLLCFSGGVDFDAAADACEALLDELQQ